MDEENVRAVPCSFLEVVEVPFLPIFQSVHINSHLDFSEQSFC